LEFHAELQQVGDSESSHCQEVQAVLPEVNVTKEFLGVDYAFLTPLLIEGIK
jgi:hypothetical protein